LEDVLAIETARAGSASGEVTSVLRTLPSRTQRRVPLRLRHPAVMILSLLGGAAIVAAAAVFLAPRTHHGSGPLPQPRPAATHAQVTLCGSCAHDYNPDAISGPKNQNPGEDGFALDGDRNTAWTTQIYYYGLQSKPGVGIYVDAKPGVAARSMVIDTATPGYSVVIYGRRSQPNPNLFDPGPKGWVQVGAAASVRSMQTIRLSTSGGPYRYYLVWITHLGNHNQVAVNEIALYR
ncbi:MAG: protein kinase domain-containing protein, partial [Acidimicrobiales bacterium]